MTEEQLRTVLEAAGVQAHSISYEAPALHVKTAYVRLPAPPLPWLANGTAATGNGTEQLHTLADTVDAEEAAMDAGGTKLAGGQ
jgi:hypothetical protein